MISGDTAGVVVRRSFMKKVFLKFLQNSQGNTCARVSFFIKKTLVQVFSYEFFKNFKNTLFYRTPLVAASDRRKHWTPLVDTRTILVRTVSNDRSGPPEVFLGKGVLKIYRKFAGENPCRSVISIKLQNNFIKITFKHGCSLVNLLYIFRTPLLRNSSGRMLLQWYFLEMGLAYLPV